MKSLYLPYLPVLLAVSLLGDPAMAKAKIKDEKLIVYSSRKEHLVKPVFAAFEKASGVKVEFVTDKAAALIRRLIAEGKNSSADLLMTVDAGNLHFAKKQGVLAKVNSRELTKSIPSHLRDSQNHWFGFSVRARPIFYNKKKVKPTTLKRYEDLAKKEWKGRLCLRTSKKVYNQSLVATMIHHLGEKKTEAIVKGWVQNLAAPVFSSDTQLLKAIAAGQCDVGIANTYYLGRLLRDNPKYPVGIFWPNQHDRGSHVNVSGAGVTTNSKNRKLAVRFLEWLATPEAQKVFADVNLEYPVNPSVESHQIVRSFGKFKQDQVKLEKAGELQPAAVKLMDRAGYN